MAVVVSLEGDRVGGREIKRRRQNSAAEGTHPRELTQTAIQCNPLNGSPDNGSIRLLVQALAGPILVLTK